MLNVTNIKFVNKGSLEAFFDVEIPGWHMTIYGCQLFSKNGRKWISLPSKKVEKEGEKTVYFPYIRFSDEVKKKFEDACLANISKQTSTSSKEEFNLF